MIAGEQLTSVSAKKPAVVHLINSLAIGGMEQVLLDTANGLAEEFDHVVITLTRATKSQLQKLPVGTVHVNMGKAEGNDWSLWYKLYALLKLHNASVLHTYNIGTIEYQIVAVCARVRVRLHAEHGRTSNDPLGLNKKYKVLRRIVDFSIHHWVVVSADLEEWLATTVGINAKKIHRIENGIDINKFGSRDFDSMQAHNDWPLAFRADASSPDFIIGSVGRLDPVKNQMMLIEALIELNEKRPFAGGKYRLVIVGDGEEMQRLSARVLEENLEDQVWLTGARSDVALLLARFDAFVLTSIAEGTPITLLEAMACTVPIVATSVGGVPALLSDGAGLLVESGDIEGISTAIEKLREDPQAARQMAERSFSLVNAQYGIERMLSSYKNLYSHRERHS